MYPPSVFWLGLTEFENNCVHHTVASRRVKRSAMRLHNGEGGVDDRWLWARVREDQYQTLGVTKVAVLQCYDPVITGVSAVLLLSAA